MKISKNAVNIIRSNLTKCGNFDLLAQSNKLIDSLVRGHDYS